MVAALPRQRLSGAAARAAAARAPPPSQPLVQNMSEVGQPYQQSPIEAFLWRRSTVQPGGLHGLERILHPSTIFNKYLITKSTSEYSITSGWLIILIAACCKCQKCP